MQTITPELAALLTTKLQAGTAAAFAGRVEVGGVAYPCSGMVIDKSLRMQADQMTATFPNEALDLGWGATSVVPTNTRIKAFQWYGSSANEVQTFDGIVDSIEDHRDVLTTTLTCRDRFALLIDQTFVASAPQAAGDTGAVRTEANGVYLNREVSYIVNDILDRVGWPTADRNIADSSMVLTEFIIGDGSTYADAITASGNLTTLTGYSAWSDELGVFQFQPTPSSDIVEVSPTPTYVWQTGVDILNLDDTTDQYELITRVRASGPLTTTTVTDGWHLIWQTMKISRPVGIMWLPGDSTRLRVISATTLEMYNLRLSDRQVMSKVYLGGVIPSPLGLSGDPADATVYWVLNAPWYYGGGTSGNSVKKVRLSDNVVLATYAIPDGRWSALKVSSSYLYLTNLDTDRFYRRSKTTGGAVADYTHTYNSVTQTNPSGLMVDGSTLFLFWANGGTTARFLKCDESAPGTVTGAVATSGSNLHGGEMNTSTHTTCWGDNDSLGLTAEFSLVTTSTGTIPVTLESVDTALEDELGTLAQLENRVHDTHPGDAAHPWESRRMSLALDKISSTAQAGDIAKFWLDKMGRRKRVLDAGIIGNPAVQKNDLVRVEDPVTGISQNFVLDTIHTEMGDTYLGTVSLVRGGVANDEITQPDPPPADPPSTDPAQPSVIQTIDSPTESLCRPALDWTVGNIQIGFIARRGGGSAFSGSGWSLLGHGTGGSTSTGGVTRSCDMYTRTVVSGDTKNGPGGSGGWYSGGGGDTAWIAEVADAGTITEVHVDNTWGSSAFSGGAASPAGAGLLVAGAAMGDFDSDENKMASVDAGVIQFSNHDYHGSGNAPWLWGGYLIVDGASAVTGTLMDEGGVGAIGYTAVTAVVEP